MTRAEVIDWQKRYRALPEVWGVNVTYEGVTELTGNAYASREAAELEAAFMRSKRFNARVVSLGHLETLELAREHWVLP